MILTLITIVRRFFWDCHGVQGVLYLKHQLEVQKIGTPIFPWIFQGLWFHPWVKPRVTLDHPHEKLQHDDEVNSRIRWWCFFSNQWKRNRIRMEGKTYCMNLPFLVINLRAWWISSVFASQLTIGIPLKLTQKDLQELAAFHLESNSTKQLGRPRW